VKISGPLVSARSLSKQFDDFVAVDGIDFEVRPGEVFGFLGPNGAGKSSTMRMIGCVSAATSGELRVLGLDPATEGPSIRARLGTGWPSCSSSSSSPTGPTAGSIPCPVA